MKMIADYYEENKEQLNMSWEEFDNMRNTDTERAEEIDAVCAVRWKNILKENGIFVS